MRTVNDLPDIDPSDLVDAASTPPPRYGRWMMVAGLAVGIPVAALVLVLGSLPEMSPAEIVQMEGYAGRQQVVTPAVPLKQVEIAGFASVDKDVQPAPVEAIAEQSSFREIAAANQVIDKPLVDPTPAAPDDVYPVLQVKKQYSNVRAGPSTNDSILTSLEVGSTVTVFERSGDWLQVGVNDGSSVTGYIHKSLLGIIADR